MHNELMLTTAIVLLVLGLFLLMQAARRRKATGLPGGEVIYADTSQWAPPEKPLYDPHVGLAGKPDYLVKQGEITDTRTGNGNKWRNPGARGDKNRHSLRRFEGEISVWAGQF